jgi:hypothetical protein
MLAVRLRGAHHRAVEATRARGEATLGAGGVHGAADEGLLVAACETVEGVSFGHADSLR